MELLEALTPPWEQTSCLGQWEPQISAGSSPCLPAFSAPPGTENLQHWPPTMACQLSHLRREAHTSSPPARPTLHLSLLSLSGSLPANQVPFLSPSQPNSCCCNHSHLLVPRLRLSRHFSSSTVPQVQR